MLARLLADPNAMSVENLERRQRQESENNDAQPQLLPKQQNPPMPPMPRGAAVSADELESDLKGMTVGDKDVPQQQTLLSPMAFAASDTNNSRLGSGRNVSHANVSWCVAQAPFVRQAGVFYL